MMAAQSVALMAGTKAAKTVDERVEMMAVKTVAMMAGQKVVQTVDLMVDLMADRMGTQSVAETAVGMVV